MKTIRRAALAAALCSLPVIASAQGFYGMQNDPQVMTAFNQMASTFGALCQSGDPNGCQGLQYVQNFAGSMYNASNDCLQGNRNGCAYYSQAYQQLNVEYGQFLNAMAMRQARGGVPQTAQQHMDNMQAIHNWGQSALQAGRESSAALDRNHEAFMSWLRN